jgi:hypothetical protein
LRFRYRHLLAEKGAQLGDSAAKLRGGLQKLDETREQVGAMQVVCQEKKVTVAKAKKDCEELLVEIVQEKRVVDEQERQVGPRYSLSNQANECRCCAQVKGLPSDSCFKWRALLGTVLNSERRLVGRFALPEISP